MKKWRKAAALLLAIAMLLSLTACSGDSGSSTTTSSTTETSSSTEESSTVEESSTAEESSEVDGTETTDLTSTPRNETFYISGLQYNKPTNNNPFSSSPNFTPVSQTDTAIELVWETLYMYNPLNGEAVPLLADGEYIWDDDFSTMTVKIKSAAMWSDGTPVTAADVAHTYDCHVKYQSSFGIDYSQYIESVEAVDDTTVKFHTIADNLNPLKVEEYVCKVYVQQKAYLEALDEELGGDSTEMKNATMWDAPTSGPYTPTLYDSEEKWICTRRDDYWGQDESMWGSLAVPKYVVHNIYKDNEAASRAFRNGEIDCAQSYTANINDYWEVDGLPISTWFDDEPYQLGMSMPSAIYNTQKEGLDQAAVRKAIAMAVDYDHIRSSAMTNQAYSFSDVPRSLFNPTEAEQSLIRDADALAEYQWEGNDIEGAIALLDEAGIVDTDGDGIREYPAGNNLTFKCECPTGWSDWEAMMTDVAAAGQAIGINLETYFPESQQWTEDYQTGNFDIIMYTYSGASITNPWTRAYQTLYGFGGVENMPETMSFNFGRYYNERADEILSLIPTETDEDKILEYYEELNIIYLDEVPCFSLTYRPVSWYNCNETVWTNYPAAGDENEIPPLVCLYGYAIAALYQLELVEG